MSSDVIYFSDDQTKAYNEVVSTLRLSGIDLDQEKLSAKFDRQSSLLVSLEELEQEKHY